MDLFSTPFMYGRLPDEVVRDTLKAVEELEAKYPGDQPHPWHCDIWTTYEVEPHLFNNPAFRPMAETLNGFASEYCRMRKVKVPIRLSEFWANVQHPGQYQESHHHRGRLISGALYLQVPDDPSVSITFCTPRIHLYDDQHWDCDADKEEISIIPQVGDILLFPSWLVHCTRPVKEKRISMSFNYIQDTTQ